LVSKVKRATHRYFRQDVDSSSPKVFESQKYQRPSIIRRMEREDPKKAEYCEKKRNTYRPEISNTS